MRELGEKTAVVTGGGSGLGRELALSCARRGMHIAIGDVDQAGTAETERLILAQTPQAKVWSTKLDVSDLAAVRSFADEVFARFGGAHLLFNNAGVAVAGPLWEYTQDDWTWVLGVNLHGVAWGIKAFTPRMIAQGEGHIVNVASAAGFVHANNLGVYNVTKSGVVAMSETLSCDLRVAQANVGVTVVCPAFFRTGIADSARNRPKALGDTAARRNVGKERETAVRKALDEATITAKDVAEMTLHAVEENRFYVFPHREIKEVISKRFESAMEEGQPLPI